jgi:uncharacterized protein (TIGR03083 family)
MLDLAGAIERESAALAAIADLAAPVPACPGWDVAELLRHVGSAHRNAGRIVAERLQHHPDRTELLAPDGVDPVAWLTTNTTALLDALASTDPATPAWSFGPDRTAAFWARRMAHETVVHRVDAEQAVGRPSAVAADVADDGIDESLHVFLPMLARADTGPAGGELLLHALDGRSWVVVVGDGTATVEADHRKGDACVQGSAADLYLWLWGRVPDDAVTWYGDRVLADRLARLTRI